MGKGERYDLEKIEDELWLGRIRLPTINLQEKMKKIKKPWTPTDIANFNNQVIRIALFKGQYHWHSHGQDEIFFVVKGQITIEIKNGKDIRLSKNEIVVVPKGIEHRTKSDKGAYVLMFEPLKLKSSGN